MLAKMGGQKGEPMPTRGPKCAVCPVDWAERFCRREGGKAPEGCPSILHKGLAEEAMKELGSTSHLSG